MTQTYCYLPITKDGVLSQAVLQAVDAGFSRLRTGGVKALWRFAYDKLDPGENNYTGSTILGHLDQLVTEKFAVKNAGKLL